MKKRVRSGVIRLILALALIAGALYIGKEAMPLIKLGLDLDGGVSITYQALGDNPSKTDMEDTVYRMQLKAQDYSNEAEVYQEGSNRINIDIPGVSDANAILEELGKPGTLYFVEGELTWPFKASVSEASKSEALRIMGRSNTSTANAITGSVSNAQSAVQNLLGGNVNLEGANVIQHADGSITIGGTPDYEAGDTLLSNDTNTPDTTADNANEELGTLDLSLFDYEKDPIFDDSQIVITGTDIVEAQGGMYNDNYGQTQYVVDLTFTEQGKQKFSDATARNIGRIIYIIYNGKIVSYPTVQTQISDGRAQITGMGNLEQANLLASTIRIGALPLELEEQRSNVVGAKLGADAISTSLKAGLIGFIIVCIFMICIYRVSGLSAALALCLYVGLMLFLLQNFLITLTLPGIAGIILSIGMAVDANVIIFTRIKEELGLGKNAKAAIQEGFHKALSAIMDGNITTLIAAAVLFIKGTGSIRGFAQTLALGIVLSLITALFFTRFILKAFLYLGFEDPKFYGVKKEVKEPINFVGFRKISYVISISVASAIHLALVLTSRVVHLLL
ncbi:MAG: protein translocase subunit SecD [Lachnospiraceae bacterium]|nr:protein translocase subunit SecD [Lachnospiraceae bacterium]